jgi:hypothetical protein
VKAGGKQKIRQPELRIFIGERKKESENSIFTDIHVVGYRICFDH